MQSAVGGVVEPGSGQLLFFRFEALPASVSCHFLGLLYLFGRTNFDNHVEKLGAALPGSGELHWRKVSSLSESYRLLRPIHRRGLLQSTRQWQGGGGTSQ